MKSIGILCIVLAGVQAAFPKNFEFGASTAAFQIEGAWLEENKGMSVWDNIAHSLQIADNSTADKVCDSYHLYPEDISLMKEYGLKNYRMSIAWARILPYGVKGSPVNQKAIRHYRTQFMALLKAGITPYVTLFHNDMPMYLRIVGKGYTDSEFVSDFLNYADICFEHFGDLVKYWFTFNEPWCLAVLDYFSDIEVNTEPYERGHQLLLAHAETVHLFKTKYAKDQKGKIGWVVNSEMYYPKNPENIKDQEAAERCIVMQLDWFSEPLFTGDYPKLLKEILGKRLPEFTTEQKRKLKGSLDFFALNHYFSFITEPAKKSEELRGFWDDRNAKTSYKEEWKRTDTDWPIVPEGIHDLLIRVKTLWIKDSGLEVFITENGAALKEDDAKSALDDGVRVFYLHKYIDQIARAIEEGVNVTKYFIWSMLDNFEWGSGISKRFGITRVEYGDSPKRIPKGSLNWYSDFIKSLS